MHHRYQSFLTSYDEKSLSFAWVNVLLITVDNSPKVSCSSPSWCPWWGLIWLSSPFTSPRSLNFYPEPLCNSPKLSPVIEMSYVYPLTCVMSHTLHEHLLNVGCMGLGGGDNFTKMHIDWLTVSFLQPKELILREAEKKLYPLLTGTLPKMYDLKLTVGVHVITASWK